MSFHPIVPVKAGTVDEDINGAKSRLTSRTISFTAALSLTLQRSYAPSCPSSCGNLGCTSRPLSPFMSTTAISAPLAARYLAITSPSLGQPPVTIATFPSRLKALNIIHPLSCVIPIYPNQLDCFTNFLNSMYWFVSPSHEERSQLGSGTL